MKKLLLALVFTSFTVLASPKEELSARLEQNNGFTADFTQQVISPDNEVVQEAEGYVDVARPSLFRWTTTMPDENVLVSDGKTLWYYSPFIEQVTIYGQEQIMARTPFVLLTRNRDSDWDSYLISQEADRFTLTPTALDSTMGQFQIDIDTQGVVQGFNIIEQDGQRSQFTFSNFSSDVPDKQTFTFTVPEGVEVDDQR
ncbi:outer membrane lipoprotein carrier protein LolA [Vibrio albus]|uniref:Outer-membrane lipoprotein carrier protein n=1 Tax=Vibrio albus TaxID=2200953 RepID=A0A2U3BAS1_9VIBR|nr:outer membrane lipoprotein chaperone LolA [Vibrio albus]PWI33899.1 outer membrane lipoprotein carrier protein LolA [Vibrio albus]